jgi:hypothetical protein
LSRLSSRSHSSTPLSSSFSVACCGSFSSANAIFLKVESAKASLSSRHKLRCHLERRPPSLTLSSAVDCPSSTPALVPDPQPCQAVPLQSVFHPSLSRSYPFYPRYAVVLLLPDRRTCGASNNDRPGYSWQEPKDSEIVSIPKNSERACRRPNKSFKNNYLDAQK